MAVGALTGTGSPAPAFPVPTGAAVAGFGQEWPWAWPWADPPAPERCCPLQRLKENSVKQTQHRDSALICG